jgi:hypothetical protein
MIRDSPERFAAATSGFASKRQLLFSSAAVCADDLIIGSSVLDFHSLTPVSSQRGTVAPERTDESNFCGTQ